MSDTATIVRPSVAGTLAKLFAAVCLLTAVLFCWHTMAVAVGGFGVELVSPSGGRVSETVGLEAHTESDASEVFFAIRAEDGSLPEDIIITGTRSAASAQIWVGSWETERLNNGYYLITARGISVTGVSHASPATLVQLENATGSSGSPDSPTTTVLEPLGGEVVSGMIEFVASTNTDPESVMFVLAGPAVSAAIPIEAAPAGPGIWTASWDSRTVPGGEYEVQAQSVIPIGINESDRVLFTIDNPELGVEITRPVSGSAHTGGVLLTAHTSMPVGSLKFEVRDSGGEIMAENIPAHQTGGSDWTDWEAEWDSSGASSGVYSVVADTPDGESRPVLFVVEADSTDPPPTDGGDEELFVTMTDPTFDAVLSGSVALRAVASSGADRLKFVLLDFLGADDPTAIDATYNATSDGWLAEWDTEGVPNGTYYLRPVALFGTRNVDGESVRVTVDNGDSVGLAVHISVPSSGAALAGNVELVASTTKTADSLLFRITLLSASGSMEPWELQATSSMDGRSWSVEWSTSEQASGDYQLVAMASDDGVTVASAPIVVAIEGSRMNVAMVSPTDGSEWSGMIILAAVTEPPAESLRFNITQSDVAGGGYPIEADYDPTIGGWVAEMSASSLLPGLYRIQAAATDPRGDNHVSGPIEISIVGEGDRPGDVPDEVAPEDLIGLTATVLHPAAGATLIGLYELMAELDGSALELHFVFVPAEDAASAAAVQVAAGETADGLWAADWDSTEVPNGPYRVRVRAAVSEGMIVYSDWIPLTVENEFDGGPVELAIVSPANDAEVDGSVSITVETTVEVDAVAVVVESMTATDYYVRLEAAPVGEQTWVAVWGTATVPPGEYGLAAVASVGEVGAVSNQVAVRIVSADAGLDNDDAGADGSADEPDGTDEPLGEDSSTGDDGITPDDVAGPEQIELTLDAPSEGSVRGIVLLLANAAGPLSDIEFVLRDNSDGRIVFVRRAAYDASLGQWVSYWHSTNAEPGSYELHVRGQDRVRQTIKSESVELLVLSHEEPTDGDKPVIPIIVEIPNEAVREAILELPEGTRTAFTPDEPQDVAAAENALRDECVEVGVSPEQCELWLASRYGSEQCRHAGILTKSECLAHLAEIQGGRIAECASYDDDKCREFTARATQGLLDDTSLENLSRDVQPFIGEEVILPPADGAPGDLPDTVADNLPVIGDGQERVWIYASPAYVQVDEQISRHAIPAVLLVDTDGDGLPDDAERRLGTDPTDPDTDGDGYDDGAEIRNGYNPLGSGTLGDMWSGQGSPLAPIDVAILSGLPLEQPLHTGELNDELSIGIRGFDPDAGTAAGDGSDADEGLVFEGRAEPGVVVTLFIYSYLPIVLTAEADANGNWSYEMDKNLVDGRHEIYVTVTDDTGRIREKGDPLSFFVSEAEAVTEENFFGITVLDESPYLSPEDVTKKEFNWYIMGAIGMAVVVLLIGMVIIARPRKKMDYRDL